MHQVLFHVPLFKDSFPPDGIPVYGFGAMLFITFVACTIWGTQRAKSVGLDAPRVQDMAIVLFLSGIIGARILYMIQYSHQFPSNDVLGLIGAFFQIWKGGIVFYGAAFGGAVGYGLFYWFVLRKLKIDGWRLADAVAPIICLGLAIGRIGCYLNGCCWGQIACEETRPVPLGAAHFPLLPAHDQRQLVSQAPNVAYAYVQTSGGFALAGRSRLGPDDPRSVVIGVEPGSAAEKAGLKPGDKIVKVNGRPNGVVASVTGEVRENVKAAVDQFRKEGLQVNEPEGGAKNEPDRSPRVYFDDYAQFVQARERVEQGALPVKLTAADYLWDDAANWPRGQEELRLGVLRDGKEIDLPPFIPRTVGLYPTQLYETISMVLLIFVLLAYYPFRRHDGQLLILCMIGYAVHRFINESIRIEPSYSLGLTLSQWGSVVILVVALGLEAYLWRVMPSRWAGESAPATPGGGEAAGGTTKPV
jgi:prolipoprotein diacylglyceryltransferase